jgi:hypothetical protein
MKIDKKNTENRTEEIWFMFGSWFLYRGTYRSTEFGAIAMAQQQPTKKPKPI